MEDLVLNLNRQRKAYLKLKELITFTSEAIKKEDWERAAQISQAEEEIKKEIIDLSRKVSHIFSSPLPPLVKEALFGLVQAAIEVKENMAEVISLIESYREKGRVEKEMWQKVKGTFCAYQKHTSISPRFLQKNV